MKRKLVLSAAFVILLSMVLALFAFAEDVSETVTEPSNTVDSTFAFADGDPLIIYSDSKKITLLPVKMTVDLTDDGKVTIADARMLLRYSTQLEVYTGAVENIDVTQDGEISAIDARLVLRYSVDLDRYYRLADGSVFSGFATTENNNLLMLDDYGAVSTGLKTVDDSVYYFENGVAVTGTKYINGVLYYFDSEAKGVSGEFSVNGKNIYFTNGKCYTGYRTVSGSNIYYADGVPANGSFKINDKTLYFKDGKLYTGYITESGENVYYADGEPANGSFKINDKTLYFKDGKLYTGYITESGENVYYADGVPANGTFELNGKKYQFENGTSYTGYKTVNGSNLYYVNGIIADGFATINSDTYYFTKGVMQYSWKCINNEYYYFNRSNGKMAKSTTVDGLTVGSDGKAVKTNYSVEKIKTFIKARNIMLSITNPTDTVEEKKLKCFNWVMKCPYKQYRKVGASMKTSGWEMLFANDIFNNGNGCCGSTSAAFAFLAVEAGCKNVYFCDDGVSTGGHAWVTMEGNNRVYDVIFAESKGFNKNYNASVSDYRSKAPRKTYIGG